MDIIQQETVKEMVRVLSTITTSLISDSPTDQNMLVIRDYEWVGNTHLVCEVGNRGRLHMLISETATVDEGILYLGSAWWDSSGGSDEIKYRKRIWLYMPFTFDPILKISAYAKLIVNEMNNTPKQIPMFKSELS